MTPVKNAALTDVSSERRADDSDFKWSSFYGDSLYKRNLILSVF